MLRNSLNEIYSARVTGVDSAGRGEIALQFAERGDVPILPLKAGQVITVVYVVGQSSYKRLYRVSSSESGSLEYACEPSGDVERLGARAPASVGVSIPGRQWPIRDARAKGEPVDSSSAADMVVREVGISTITCELGEGQAQYLHRVSVGMQVVLEFELPRVGPFEGRSVRVKACIYADSFHPIAGTRPLYRTELVDVNPATEQLLARFVFAAQVEARRRGHATDSPAS